jgi:hypothetical protein
MTRPLEAEAAQRAGLSAKQWQVEIEELEEEEAEEEATDGFLLIERLRNFLDQERSSRCWGRLEWLASS